MKKPELKTYPSGAQAWYLNGELHREGGRTAKPWQRLINTNQVKIVVGSAVATLLFVLWVML